MSLVTTKFAIGDKALLIYQRGNRRYVVPVIVGDVNHEWPPDGLFSSVTMNNGLLTIDNIVVKGLKIISYVVLSGLGGSLEVPAHMLRSYSVLDQIVTSLDQET